MSLVWLSWLGMMLVHEGGHVLGALLTGGAVQQIVWHPLAISRTDVEPNPSPLIVVWAGPIIGCAGPLFIAILFSCLVRSAAYLVWFFAGFCLIANGSYIGIGAFDPVGDASQMIRLGTPKWVMAGFGTLTNIAGLWIWHRVSADLGFGHVPRAIQSAHVLIVLVFAAALTILGMLR